MSNPNFSHSDTVSMQRAALGFAQLIVDPNDSASMVFRNYYSTVHTLLFELVFSKTSYLAYLPEGAFIKQITLSKKTDWSANAAFEIGSTAGGSDVTGSVPLATYTITLPNNPFLVSPLLYTRYQTLQAVYVTITGDPTEGSTYLMVDYFNTIVRK